MNAADADPEQRFTDVYEASYGAIHAYAARRLGREMADEVAAETFLVAWKRLDVLPPVPLPWLYGIARNIVARYQSKLGRQRATESALAHEYGRRDHALHQTEDPALWEAWEQLRPRDREVLALIAWEELSVAQAAQVLECPPAIFSVRLHRARRRLERMLSGPRPQPIPSTELSEV